MNSQMFDDFHIRMTIAKHTMKGIFGRFIGWPVNKKDWVTMGDMGKVANCWTRTIMHRSSRYPGDELTLKGTKMSTYLKRT